jgi:hypothetical protein
MRISAALKGSICLPLKNSLIQRSVSKSNPYYKVMKEVRELAAQVIVRELLLTTLKARKTPRRCT